MIQLSPKTQRMLLKNREAIRKGWLIFLFSGLVLSFLWLIISCK